MKAPTVDDIINEVLRREGHGAFTNRAADRGGPTRWGVSLKTLQSRKAGATIDDVRALTEDEARRIYLEDYVQRPGFDRLPEPLRSLLVDFGVTSGPARAIKALQLAVGAHPDGVIGFDTRTRLSARDSASVYASVLRQYLGHFVSVALNDDEVEAFRKAHPNTQLENLRGWWNRAAEFIR